MTDHKVTPGLLGMLGVFGLFGLFGLLGRGLLLGLLLSTPPSGSKRHV